MSKTVKRMLSVLFCAVLLLGTIASSGKELGQFSMKAMAGTNGHTQAEAVAYVNSLVFAGKKLDYDGNGAWCIDLIHYYYAYLGYSNPSGNANTYDDNALPSGWTRVYSNPQPGDIYQTDAGQYGHVAVVTEIRGSNIVVVQQSQNTAPFASLEAASSAKCYIRPDFRSHTCDYMASATISKAPTRTATGTRVRTCSCGKTINETIPAIPYTTDLAEGIYTITSKCGSGLKVSTNSNNNYNVFIADGDWPDQYWLFRKNSDGTYTIENAYYNNRVLDVAGVSMVNDGNIYTYEDYGVDNQKFYVIPVGNYYKLVAKNSYLNVDNYCCGTTNGNNIIQYQDNGSDAQRWALKLSNPSLSLSSSSVNVSAGSSKTVNCTVGRETRGVTASYLIADTSVCSASWGSWNGMTCPLTITGKAGGTTTVKVTIKDGDTGIVYDTKTITVTVPGAASYTLTYNANGGTGAPASQTGSGNITLSNTKPTRSGYTFKGWATSAGATTAQFSAGASFNLMGNVTLYAVWQKNATPAQPTVKSVAISDFTLNYRFSTTPQPQITADEGAEYTVSYSSSNPNVVSVDANGRVTGVKRGTAIITCTVTDEYGNSVSDHCIVTVSYTVWQWIIRIMLFGWLWY
ncbi:MAG: InlB B-repeat-containing protein [Clostridia bacterium]|nr:InlB B-repeat-containing protein [Clostridia bacterium]